MQLRVVALAVSLCACKSSSVPAPIEAPAPAPSRVRATPAPRERPRTATPRVRPRTPTPRAGTGESGKLVGLTDAHNRVRREVGVAPLVWSDELARWAGAWASRLAAKGCQLTHRPARADDYGENIFWSSGPMAAGDVVATWAGERSGYDHATNACDGVCGHFTQIVWRASKRLGCGSASCAGGGEIWVCNYDPPGNVMGQSPY